MSIVGSLGTATKPSGTWLDSSRSMWARSSVSIECVRVVRLCPLLQCILRASTWSFFIPPPQPQGLLPEHRQHRSGLRNTRCPEGLSLAVLMQAPEPCPVPLVASQGLQTEAPWQELLA